MNLFSLGSRTYKLPPIVRSVEPRIVLRCSKRIPFSIAISPKLAVCRVLLEYLHTCCTIRESGSDSLRFLMRFALARPCSRAHGTSRRTSFLCTDHVGCSRPMTSVGPFPCSTIGGNDFRILSGEEGPSVFFAWGWLVGWLGGWLVGRSVGRTDGATAACSSLR